MADESIVIEVKDQVATTIGDKLLTIAGNAREANTALESLKKALAAVTTGGGLTKLKSELASLSPVINNAVSAVDKLAAADGRATLARQRLATETQKTQAAMAQVETAINKAIEAEAKAETATNNLAAAQMKASTEAQKFITEQERTAQATASASIELERLEQAQNATAQSVARLSAEQSKAETASAQLATAQSNAAIAEQRLEEATVKTATAQTNGQLAAQKLATEQERTAKAHSEAAIAADRAALSALRLEQAQNDAKRSSDNLGGSLVTLKNVLFALVGALSLKYFADLTSQMTDYDSRIKRATGSAEAATAVYNRLNDMGRRTYTTYEQTANSFLANATALRELGYSTNQQLDFTETLNNALVVSGAKAERAAQVQDALAKAMALGTLRGVNLNSVIQVGGRVAELLAEQLGTTVNNLRRLGQQGKITGDVIYKALAGNLEKVRAEADAMPATINDGLMLVRESFATMVWEMDKATGVSQAFAGALVWIADNLKLVMVVLAPLGGALIAAFGPRLLTMLSLATKGMWAFTAAIAANPVGLLVVALTTAAVAIAAFGDNVMVSAEKSVTLKDMFRTAFAYIKDYAQAAGDWIVETWNSAIDLMNESTGGWAEQFRKIGTVILSAARTVINTLVGLWSAAPKVIGLVWRNLPTLLQGFFIDIVNFASTSISQLLNLWQEGLRLIGRMVGSVAPDVESKLNSALDSIKINLPKLQVSKPAKVAAKEINDVFKTELSKDFVGNFMDRAAQISAARRAKEAAEANVNLDGKTTPGATDSPLSKAAESRAVSMAKVNAQLDNELARMTMLKPLREAQAKFDQIEETLLGKKIKLTEAEAASIKRRIQLIQDNIVVQGEFDRLYEAAIAPMRDYNATLTAAAQLLAQGAISQDQYRGAVARATDVMQDGVDPLHRYNKEMNDQITLLRMMPREREVEQKLQQANNELLAKGIILTNEQADALRSKVEAVQRANEASAAESALMDSTVGKRLEVINQLNAIKTLMENTTSGFGAGDAAQSTAALISSLGLDPSMLQIQTEANVNIFKTMYDQIAEMRARDVIGEQDASALRMQVWAQQQKAQFASTQTFLSSIAQLQSSNNKKMAAIGKAAAIANAVINTYTAATGAYAAMASIPFVGPFLGAAAAGAAVVAGMANVAAIRSQNTNGFKKGGYTGDFGINEEVGAVHGREYVMDAQSTSRVGVDDLNALRSGAAEVVRNDKRAGTPGNSVGNSGKAQGGKSITQNAYFTLPGITDAKEAEQSTAAISRGIVAAFNDAQRYT